MQDPNGNGFNAVEWNPLRWAWNFFDRPSVQVTTLRTADMRETARQKEENAAFSHDEEFEVYLVDFTVHYRVNPDHGFNEDGRVNDWVYTLARKTTSDPWKIVSYGFDD